MGLSRRALLTVPPPQSPGDYLADQVPEAGLVLAGQVELAQPARRHVHDHFSRRVDRGLVAVMGWGTPTVIGHAWIVLQAAVVGGFAALQWTGSRRRSNRS